MKIASIDIGSNTVLLLIAFIKEGNLKPIFNKYETPRLGKGLKIGGNILDDRIEHLIEILQDYKTIISKYHCEKIIITATNAMRIAGNSSNIISRVKKELNLDIQIIEGEEEARLSFLGASSSIPKENDKVVIDIGGGSTEIIYGNREKILFKNSFQTGVVSLTEKFLHKFPYSDKALNDANDFLINTFRLAEKNIPKNTTVIAVAGTPTTLSCIKQNLKNYDEKLVENSYLDQNDFRNLYKSLLTLDGLSVREKFGTIVHGREDILFSGLLILKYLKSIFAADRIIVSGRGLRYGNIINYINNVKE